MKKVFSLALCVVLVLGVCCAANALEIRKQILDDVLLTVALEGRLDTTTAPKLEGEIESSLNDGITKLVFDMAKLEYISSAGLRVLLSAQKMMNKRSGEMVVRNVNDDIMDILEITGFTDLLDIE